MSRYCPYCRRPVALTPEAREEIRAASPGDIRALARKYGVDRRTVQRVREKRESRLSRVTQRVTSP